MAIDEWCKAHEEFGDAIAHARDLAMAWWEDAGQSGMWQSPEGVRLNPQLWSRSMSARFPDDYSERREITGKGGGAIQSQVVIATGVPHLDDGCDLV